MKKRRGDLNLQEVGQNFTRLIGMQATETRYLDQFAVKTDGITTFVRAPNVDWIEAAGVYVTFHSSRKEILYRCSLNDLEKSLDPIRFLRIHRSVIVNVDIIVQLEPLSHGEFECSSKTVRIPASAEPIATRWKGALAKSSSPISEGFSSNPPQKSSRSQARL